MSLRLTGYSEISQKGPRHEMQDVTLAQQGHGSLYLFSVLDGHNEQGELFAQRAADEIEHVPALSGGLTALETAGVVRDQLRRLHRTLRQQMPGSTGGTTATVAAIKVPDLAVAWLGDSRAAFFPDSSRTIHLTKPHNVSHRAEVERAALFPDGALEQDDDGHMYFGGKLAVSRAVGDFHCEFVIPEADITTYRLRESGIFVAASDGVWGSSQAGHSAVEDIVRYGDPNDMGDIADTLAEMAWRTNDNASAIVARIE